MAKLSKVIPLDGGPSIRLVDVAGTRWASRLDLLAMCHQFGIEIEVKKSVLAKVVDIPEADVFCSFTTFGISDPDTAPSSIFVRGVAPTPVKHATEAALKTLRREMYLSEERHEWRMEKAEGRIAALEKLIANSDNLPLKSVKSQPTA